MGFSKLGIPKLCEYCQKPFEAKTITTRFCCKECSRHYHIQEFFQHLNFYGLFHFLFLKDVLVIFSSLSIN